MLPIQYGHSTLTARRQHVIFTVRYVKNRLTLKLNYGFQDQLTSKGKDGFEFAAFGFLFAPYKTYALSDTTCEIFSIFICMDGKPTTTPKFWVFWGRTPQNVGPRNLGHQQSHAYANPRVLSHFSLNLARRVLRGRAAVNQKSHKSHVFLTYIPPLVKARPLMRNQRNLAGRYMA